jgi:hypothetical protein
MAEIRLRALRPVARNRPAHTPVLSPGCYDKRLRRLLREMLICFRPIERPVQGKAGVDPWDDGASELQRRHPCPKSRDIRKVRIVGSPRIVAPARNGEPRIGESGTRLSSGYSSTAAVGQIEGAVAIGGEESRPTPDPLVMEGCCRKRGGPGRPTARRCRPSPAEPFSGCPEATSG